MPKGVGVSMSEFIINNQCAGLIPRHTVNRLNEFFYIFWGELLLINTPGKKRRSKPFLTELFEHPSQLR